jgi:hypothetical protein
MQIVGFGLNQEGPGAGLWQRSGALPYRAALLTLLPTYAWIAEDLAAGAVAAWPCAVTGVQATQATAGARPTQSATALNSRPGLTFDGGDRLSTPAFASDLAQPYSAVFALMTTTTGGNGAWFDGFTMFKRATHSQVYAPPLRIVINATGDGTYTTAPLPTNTAVTIRTVMNGASSSIALNGAAQTVSTGTLPLGGATIGSRHDGLVPFTGIIGDILIFSGTDYAARAAAADALMRAYYGI